IDLSEFVIQALCGEFEARRAVGIGLDDLGAGFDVFAVYREHDVGAGEVQLVVTPVDVNAFGIDHRAHRAVKDADTIFPDKVAELVHKISGSKTKDLALKTTRGLLRFLIVNIKTGFPVWLFSCFLRGAIRRKSPRADHFQRKSGGRRIRPFDRGSSPY